MCSLHGGLTRIYVVTHTRSTSSDALTLFIGVNPAGDAGDVSPFPTNILVGGHINGNVPTNIRGGNVVDYELLIASVKRKQR